MGEADNQLRPLHTSIFDMYKVFEPLVCCLKGIWLHPYTCTQAKLPPDLGSQVHLRCWNDDAITSQLRLISTSHYFMRPYWTYMKCGNLWYGVSRAHGCTIIPGTLAELAPNLGILGCLCNGIGTITSRLRLISTSDCFPHPFLT